MKHILVIDRFDIEVLRNQYKYRWKIEKNNSVKLQYCTHFQRGIDIKMYYVINIYVCRCEL